MKMKIINIAKNGFNDDIKLLTITFNHLWPRIKRAVVDLILFMLCIPVAKQYEKDQLADNR